MSDLVWRDGPPPEEDGEYLGESGDLSWRFARKNGDWLWLSKAKIDGFEAIAKKMTRHLCLPPIPEPLKLPRRFRAKYEERETVGVYVPDHDGDEYAWTVLSPNGFYEWAAERELEHIEWIDDEQGNQVKP